MARASRMTREGRRAHIIAAARPLFAELGAMVTTRQVAEAAGIAEGTIFRVFHSMADLLASVVDAAMDPTETTRELREIPEERPLEEKVTDVVRIVASWVHETTALTHAIQHTKGLSRPPTKGRRMRARLHSHTEEINQAVAELLAPHSADLRTPPAQAAAVINLLAIATEHPLTQTPTDPRLITEIALLGLLATKETE